MYMHQLIHMFKRWLHSPLSQESWSHLEMTLMWICVISVIVSAIVLVIHQIYLDYVVNDCLSFIRD